MRVTIVAGLIRAVSTRQWRAAAAIAILLGIAWRVAQFTFSPSLAIDEAALARSLIVRDPTALFDRLDYSQHAPIGFLLAVKACVIAFGSSEWSLRLVPFLAGIAAMPLFYLVARRILDEPAAAVATVLFALATPLAVWSTIFKQYSSDVLCALAVIAVSQRMLSRTLTRRDIALAVVVGFGAASSSHGALIVLAASGAVLVAECLHRRRRDIVARLLIVAGWAATVVSVIVWTRGMRSHSDDLYLRKFWQPLFVPMDAGDAKDWLWERFALTVAEGPWPNAGLMYDWPKLWALLLVAGMLGILKERPFQALLVAGPFLLTMAASAMKQFPFGGRVCLFLIPLFLVLFVAGARAIGSLMGRTAAVLAPLAMIPIAAISLARFPPSFSPEHIRPHLEYLATRLERGDAVWVYYGAARAFDYYAARLPIRAETTFGECDRTDPRANLRQLDTLRGRARAWVVLSHAVRDEQQAMLEYLNSIGALQEHSVSHESSMAGGVYLYKLDDPERLHRADAETFAVPAIDEPSAWSCFGPVSTGPEGDRAAIEALEREQN